MSTSAYLVRHRDDSDTSNAASPESPFAGPSHANFALIDNDASQHTELKFIGAGRGAQVFALRSADGSIIAKKVFVGSGLARMVHQFFFGCDNPYVWDATAVDEALHRRRILSPLVLWWLNGKARVAEIFQVRWNDDLKVNEWTMEFIEGRPALLRQPFSALKDDEVADLLDNVMRPLQRHLVEAGFDGAAWQAGLYNPVATSNFLRRVRSDGQVEWVWIDVESGVPALFPANPLGLFSYYLPRWFKFGRPLFDDVDVAKLRRYLSTHEADMRRELGDAAWNTLAADVNTFEDASSRSCWKRRGRVRRGIEARLKRHEITQNQAAHYAHHALRWTMREISIGVSTALRAVMRRLVVWFHPRLWILICRESVKLLLSDAYRTLFAKRYVARSIGRWHDRKQLDRIESEALMADLDNAGTAVYLTDFGMHLAAKPLVKLITWVGVPILYAVGLMNEITFAILVIAGGAIARTLYTLMRITIAHRKGHSRPWIALGAGVFPVIGNVAFPLQLLFDGVSGGRNLSQFIVYDTASRVGQIVPIWGGADTLTEHRVNRAADWLFSLTRKFRPREGSSLRRRTGIAL